MTLPMVGAHERITPMPRDRLRTVDAQEIAYRHGYIEGYEACMNAAREGMTPREMGRFIVKHLAYWLASFKPGQGPVPPPICGDDK